MTEAKPDKAVPRYKEIADALLAGIASGEFPTGAMLPTELELCERFGVSRFTVREALRQLHDLGLLSRRRGSGTVVRDPTAEHGLVQSVGSLSELLQYPPETRLELVGTEKLGATAELARLLKCRPGKNWVKMSGVRRVSASGSPICWTDIYVLPKYGDVSAMIGTRREPVYALLAERFGEVIDNVKVELYASSVATALADDLKVAPGTPAMTIVRRYTGAHSQVFEVSVSVHPQDRFTYFINLERAFRLQPG